jgi:small subunit ribosomal protein S12
MARLNQIISKYKRGGKKIRKGLTGLGGCPQKRGRCIRVYTMKPKKPNSAIRKVVKLAIIDKKNQYITASIPGIGHSLQKNAIVLFRGGRANDLPGVRYRVLRGKLDFTEKETFKRENRRSVYGVKKEKNYN